MVPLNFFLENLSYRICSTTICGQFPLLLNGLKVEKHVKGVKDKECKECMDFLSKKNSESKYAIKKIETVLRKVII